MVKTVSRIPLLAPAPGTARTLVAHRYGEVGARPKAYLQAALHADEVPGMLVLHHLSRLLDAADDRLGLVDLPGMDTDASQPDLDVFTKLTEYTHISSTRAREFERQMIRVELVQGGDDRVVSSGMGGVPANPCAGPPTQVHGAHSTAAYPCQDLVVHVHR